MNAGPTGIIWIGIAVFTLGVLIFGVVDAISKIIHQWNHPES